MGHVSPSIGIQVTRRHGLPCPEPIGVDLAVSMYNDTRQEILLIENSGGADKPDPSKRVLGRRVAIMIMYKRNEDNPCL